MCSKFFGSFFDIKGECTAVYILPGYCAAPRGKWIVAF
jgi:hypothetical protein